MVGERSANPELLTNKKLRFYRKVHFFADYIVANSHKNLELVNKVIPRINVKKLKVIYNSVEIPKQNNFSITESDHTKIVVAASYRAVKNLGGLIEALQLLPEEYKSRLKISWYCNIAMDNNYYESQQKKIDQFNLNEVLMLHDTTNQITQKYAEADFIGLFSHFEGFPNTICEAMAMGKPVVVTKVSDVLLFIEEKENGFLSESKQAESIKNALLKAIDTTANQRIRMGEKNYAAAKQEFSKDVIVKQYLKLLGD